ncbi:hypothetical protein AB0383_00410 [Amycolatopsis sp. NPDC051373]|uniref:hypothetical protein n=1 Tax=Amycolatopsis sp. NPDC051373 TaxID=3155801 RepID=UPI00344FA9F3
MSDQAAPAQAARLDAVLQPEHGTRRGDGDRHRPVGVAPVPAQVRDLVLELGGAGCLLLEPLEHAWSPHPRPPPTRRP